MSSEEEDLDDGAFKVMILRVCDVALPALLLWQSGDTTRPAAIAAGLVVALRAAALQPSRRRRG